ncbi:ABC transporter permease [candidate division KSB1 bacterium]
MKKIKPPKFAEWIIKKVLPRDNWNTSIGDFEEYYSKLASEKSLLTALIWYWRNILFLVPRKINHTIWWGVIMFKNYMKIAIRHVFKQKMFSLINIFGLSVGMACCLLILLWVKDELSYDRFHKNADEIYRVTEYEYDSSGDYIPYAATPWPLADALKQDFPEIVESARLRVLTDMLISYKDKRFYENDFVAVDPDFLKMFSFPLIKGDISNALNEPNTVLVTEETAKRYFGNENPLGKTITYNFRHDFIVTGVIKNIPHNSHMRFDFLVPFESTLRTLGWTEAWDTSNYYTFIQLQNSADYQEMSEKIYDYRKTIYPESKTMYILQPLTDIHLRSNYAIDLYGQSEEKAVYVYVFSIIALFILFIACINFMNLSTARSDKRAKEVGMRKVVGARRSDIIAQFYGESIFLTMISLIVAILSLFLLLPLFNNLSGKELTYDIFGNPLLMLGMLGIALITGLVSGSYPALVQSSIMPVDSIKGTGLIFSVKSRKLFFRRILVVTQFTLSIILIVGVLIVNKQLNFIMNKKLGYEKEQIIYFIKRANLKLRYDAFKSDLLKNPNIVGVTASSDIQSYTVHATGGFTWEGRSQDTRFAINHFSVDHDYIKTFNMKMVEGRDFSKEFPVDAATQSFIVNETAVKAMGLEEPVGTGFTLYGNYGHIVGVVEDFHFKSLQKEIEPLCLRIEQGQDRYVFVKVNSENILDIVNSIESIYNRFNPDYSFEFAFLDETVDRLYNSEKRTAQIFNYFTLITIIISCLGLFGLAAYMAQQKTKEIGLRKALGASVPNIVKLLSKEFIILVGTANIIAWPAAFCIMNEWLNNFAYRTDIKIGLFVFAGIISLFFALITVSYQTIKAANANPVDSLRNE